MQFWKDDFSSSVFVFFQKFINIIHSTFFIPIVFFLDVKMWKCDSTMLELEKKILDATAKLNNMHNNNCSDSHNNCINNNKFMCKIDNNRNILQSYNGNITPPFSSPISASSSISTANASSSTSSINFNSNQSMPAKCNSNESNKLSINNGLCSKLSDNPLYLSKSNANSFDNNINHNIKNNSFVNFHKKFTLRKVFPFSLKN